MIVRLRRAAFLLFASRLGLPLASFTADIQTMEPHRRLASLAQGAIFTRPSLSCTSHSPSIDCAANADEAAVLAGPGTAERQASALTGIVRHAVVKRGGAGAVWCSRDGSTAAVALERVPVIDPTGAGDAFAAGLLAAWVSGAGPAEALAAGAALGVKAVTRLGARPAWRV